MDDFEKFVDGEITEAEFLERTSGLSPEEKAKLNEKVAAAEKEALAKVVALRKEGKRLEEKKNAPIDTGTKFREEQVTKATLRFKNEFGIEDADMPKYLEQFKKLDEGHVDADNIFTNFKKVYAYVNPDSLIEARSKVKEFETNAEDYLEKMASANGSSSGEGETKKRYIPEAYALVKKAKAEGTALTLDQAERYLTQGLRSKSL